VLQVGIIAALQTPPEQGETNMNRAPFAFETARASMAANEN
jgi:hypothetical protein